VKTSIERAIANFCIRRPLHDSFAWLIEIYQHCEDNSNKMGRRGKFSIALFLPIMSLLLNVLEKMVNRICRLQKKGLCLLSTYRTLGFCNLLFFF
jgi:hypothetical protein